MKNHIVIIEPFFTGSHKRWALEYQKHSRHQITLLTMTGRYWKWRMHGAAVEMTKQIKQLKERPHLVVATDMLDVATFAGLSRHYLKNIPLAVYFHENQLTYPWSATDPDVHLQRDNNYSFKNYTSALAGEKLFFNSEYHLQSYLKALPDFLQQFPDYNGLDTVDAIRKKSEVLYLGLDLRALDELEVQNEKDIPLLLWNHRWEYDKNPSLFFKTLFRLKKEGIRFELAVLGTQFPRQPKIFAEAKEYLAEEIVAFGRIEDWKEYVQWVWRADILPVTSYQDFFGQSVVEAIYCHCHPILPRRLTYPEHIPTHLHIRHLYDESEEFYHKLKNALQNFRSLRQESLQNFVKPYDWRNLAPVYDRMLQVLISK